ncbi:hypothetical protein [Halomonas sp. BC04]|uniref:hypothetical protein n=1 Tax=Halomonas sp. BC04 TaxID=1403540 RepID=UPI0003ED6E12|nr:hypothetical protein [Halomonas sp. BC04]EWH03922.1 hypothetical protein Q427_00675 [Halomonas sp. BC04]
MVQHRATTSCQTLPFAAWLRHGLFALLCLVLLFASGVAAHVATDSGTHHGAVGHVHTTATATAFAADEYQTPLCHAGHAPLFAPHTLMRTERQEIEHGVALCSLTHLAPPPL